MSLGGDTVLTAQCINKGTMTLHVMINECTVTKKSDSFWLNGPLQADFMSWASLVGPQGVSSLRWRAQG